MPSIAGLGCSACNDLGIIRSVKDRQTQPAARGRGYYSNVRNEMIPFLPETYSTVLEVGCGEGASVELLTLPCEIWGVEPEPLPAASAAARMHKVLVGRYDAVQAEIPKNYFDLVVRNDVIEHLVR